MKLNKGETYLIILEWGKAGNNGKSQLKIIKWFLAWGLLTALEIFKCSKFNFI